MITKKSTKKKPTSPYKAAKKLAWQWFSRYIRARDCLKTTGTPERGRCYTCDTERSFGVLQAGHYIDGRNNAVLFSEIGVHAQCGQCNVYKYGNKVEYRRRMIRDYGTAKVEQLEAERCREVKFTTAQLLEKADHYRRMYGELTGGE